MRRPTVGGRGQGLGLCWLPQPVGLLLREIQQSRGGGGPGSRGQSDPGGPVQRIARPPRPVGQGRRRQEHRGVSDGVDASVEGLFRGSVRR